ncbi:acireductone dioxygenase [Pseudomonas sp. NFIX28]|uniref:1,2-dihydroxy-3-keto-5-methylthiopentene dioxygenase n=1 Tax=Pseudomonas sp. NFIX28 TaxID=1566235 RepID=UPI000895CFDB|nr:acireductone dioxygenase [Pseudomonas sp. NFIX28]SDY99320.1 1,2-dihydroxy-3-keto-5-methylthiopentene dioxygenase [Pseudomonas sp. NFIX28]
MSSLSVYHVSSPDLPNKVLTHFDDIAATLAEQGVRFDRWQAATRIQPGASQEEVISAYQQQIDRLMTERGYISVDVLSLDNNHPQKAELRAKFLDEHRHGEDEVRFFVAGRGLFSLHIDDYVYAVLCEKNDLISVPAGTAHWFDMGENPYLVAIRMFNNPQGWVATATGSDIASQFPRLED